MSLRTRTSPLPQVPRPRVRSRIPIGGLGSDVYDYIEPGRQKLTGFQTQWYARARDGSDDYSRMARQKCVMGAMLDQLDPTTVLKNFQKIAKASSAMVQTSIPASEVDRFIGLALKARDQKVSTLSIVPPVFDTYHTDAKLIKEKVAEAIDTAEGNAPKQADPPAASAGAADSAADTKGGGATKPGKGAKTPAPVTGGSVGSLHDGYAANEADDLDSAC